MSEKKTVKVLAIGNSFSMDAMTVLWDIFKSAGYEEVILGDLYIAGCSLETHWHHIDSNNKAYDYYYNDNGIWQIINNKSVKEVLNSNEWDVVTIQQSSSLSGIENSFEPFLSNIINFINKNINNKKTKLAWHMTWAYQGTHTNPAFEVFEYNQIKMFNAIRQNIYNQITTKESISLIIPAGIAIQNLRNTEIGDQLTRDGYHLSSLGQYTAGLMWFKSITRKALSEVSFAPESLKQKEINLAKNAVDTANIEVIK